ncbi:hypothetical protein PHLH7_25750 [Pseudomonas sp. Ost2]|uniref:hypothetical protein n=1 Tax=Pseudomonas sp. Ost2 TaxID=2678260 RepID=UPI001BB33A1F|nr:hypothetical protein [Pseudomonas sp. Ost2]BBP76471.1 hypothetical protein PHLH7_25750 [Pseudomonas sp. Ost2]
MFYLKEIFTILLCFFSALSCWFWIKSARVTVPYIEAAVEGPLSGAFKISTDEGGSKIDVLATGREQNKWNKWAAASAALAALFQVLQSIQSYFSI